jgi:hypothetical protein
MKFLPLLVAACFFLPCFTQNAQARHHHHHHGPYMERSWHRPYHYSSYHRYDRFQPRYRHTSAVSVRVGPFEYSRSNYDPYYYGPGYYGRGYYGPRVSVGIGRHRWW